MKNIELLVRVTVTVDDDSLPSDVDSLYVDFESIMLSCDGRVINCTPVEFETMQVNVLQ